MDRNAARESLTDTLVATVINFPMNFVLIWIAFEAEMTAFQTTVFCTAILFVVALFRKYYIRIHFQERNKGHGTATQIHGQEKGNPDT